MKAVEGDRTKMPGDSFFERLNVDKLFDAPPVNNACIPDIYNKLDADTIEKTRVINSLLQERLKIQEKVLTKYKNQAEYFHKKEIEKVCFEFRKLRKRLPYMSDDPDLGTKEKVKQFRMAQSHIRTPMGYTTVPKEIPGLVTEKDDRPFCERFFTHHLPTKTKRYHSTPRLPLTARANIRTNDMVFLPSRSKDKSRKLLISRGLSASENCLVAGSKSILTVIKTDVGYMADDEDDAMTI